MKVLLIGASGVLGQGIYKHLCDLNFEVVTASRHSGDIQVDLQSEVSVQNLFQAVGKVDAIVSAIGKVHFGELSTMSAEQFNIGLQDKLLGQVRLALIGKSYLNPKGSITLTTGIIGHEPIALGVNATTVNMALEGFVRAASLEMTNGIRINVVSPTVLTEALEHYAPYFLGFTSITVREAALAYQKSIQGILNGHVFKVGY